MSKAVIFDVDGTLVDSVELHAKAWQEAFAAFGHDIEFRRLRGQIGKGGDQLMPVFLSREQIDSIGEKIDARRAEIFKTKYLPEVRGFPETRLLFQKLLAEGWRVALASSAKGEELETYKKLACIEDLVEAETSSDDAEKSKPYPDIFQAALQRLGKMDRAAAWAIGDTPYDAQAAAKAGIRTIGVRCGGWSVRDLEQAGCSAVYKDPADLLANYETSPLAR